MILFFQFNKNVFIIEFCPSPRERALQYPSLRAFSVPQGYPTSYGSFTRLRCKQVIQYMISKIAAIFGNQLTETVTPDADPESVL